ncbi:DUF2934 domain-containing protein [Rhodovulum sp. P5]|uniref:DUF2934 domain-containing protein n=1 Tax=Rhodovulum sp. P5 TaxID=1564506 RepID=UPI001560B43C|nr:DUF2934 domain-containing protein [Rhodovulum sp. P5]
MSTSQIPEDHIRTAAFYLWLEEGQPEGRDLDHWEAARNRLATDRPAKTASRSKAAKPKAAAKPRTARKKAVVKQPVDA